MMTFLISINITVTILFSMMKHPLSMGMTLLAQTILISLITGNFNQNSWFSYILFLIMIGGMLILFMYMTSVASNEKFKTNIKMTVITAFIPISFMATNEMIKTSVYNNELLNFNQAADLNISLSKFINFPLSITLLFLMIYLLLALIATVKITNFKQGSMRQMN